MLSALTRGSKLLGGTWRCADRFLRHQQRWKTGSSITDQPHTDVMTQSKEPHKSPPGAPSPDECCGTGCSDCTYLKYAEDLVDYYKDGGIVALQEVDKIADPSVRMFVKTEIKYYLALDQDVRDIIKASRQVTNNTETNSQE